MGEQILVDSLIRPSVSIPPRWAQDPDTGFLYQPVSNSGTDAFSLEKKKAFLPLYTACFPDLTEALKQTGVSRRTFYLHLKFDTEFSLAFREIQEQKADKVESAMFQVAIQPKSGAFMDRIAMLRAYRPGLYTEKRINLSARDIEPAAAQAKQQNLGSVFDAELVGEPVPGLQLPAAPQPASSDPIPGPASSNPGTAQKEGENPG